MRFVGSGGAFFAGSMMISPRRMRPAFDVARRAFDFGAEQNHVVLEGAFAALDVPDFVDLFPFLFVAAERDRHAVDLEVVVALKDQRVDFAHADRLAQVGDDGHVAAVFHAVSGRVVPAAVGQQRRSFRVGMPAAGRDAGCVGEG